MTTFARMLPDALHSFSAWADGYAVEVSSRAAQTARPVSLYHATPSASCTLRLTAAEARAIAAELAHAADLADLADEFAKGG